MLWNDDKKHSSWNERYRLTLYRIYENYIYIYIYIFIYHFVIIPLDYFFPFLFGFWIRIFHHFIEFDSKQEEVFFLNKKFASKAIQKPKGGKLVLLLFWEYDACHVHKLA